MHIPGKSLMRPKNSMFRNTDSRRISYANHLRLTVYDNPLEQGIAHGIALRLESSVGRTTTRNTTNQRKQRRARRQWWAAGDRFAFSRN